MDLNESFSNLSRGLYLDDTIVPDDPNDRALAVSGDHDVHGLTNLHTASGRGQLKMVEMALSMAQEGEGVDVVTSDGRHTPLFFAALNGHLEVVRALVGAGANVNAESRLLDTPLATACRHGHAEVVIELLVNGANMTGVTRSGDTILHAAARGGHPDIVATSLKNGLDIDACNKSGLTPLHQTAAGNHVEAAKMFLRHGANVNAGFFPEGIVKGIDRKRYHGVTALHLAAQRDAIDMVEVLLSDDANHNLMDSAGCTPLHVAVICGHAEMVRYLVKRNPASVNSGSPHNVTALHLAVSYNRMDVLRVLLNVNGIDVDSKTKTEGRNALHMASEWGDVTASLALLAGGANINMKTDKSSHTPLHLAVLYRHHRLTEVLVAGGAVVDIVDQKGVNPLHVACANGIPLQLVELLLSTGVDIESRDKNLNTPLLHAVKGGHLEIVKHLMKSGADYKVRNKWNWTVLHFAADRGHVKVARFLFDKYGPKLDILRDTKRAPRTLLQLASRSDHPEMIRLLVENGEIINQFYESGWSLLHVVCWHGTIRTAAVLLELNLDVHLRAKTDGRSALHFAVMRKEDVEGMIKLLIDHGANVNAADDNGITPMHIAAKYCEEKVVRMLLEANGYLDGKAVTLDGVMTPVELSNQNTSQQVRLLMVICDSLLEAVRGNQPSRTKSLLLARAYVNSHSLELGTALHHACKMGYLEIVNILLSHGAALNLFNAEGLTPLHCAARSGHVEVAVALLDCGAIYNIADTSPLHRRPMELARKNSCLGVSLLLTYAEKGFILASVGVGEVWQEFLRMRNGSRVSHLRALLHARNRKGQTMADVAWGSGHFRLANRLRTMTDN